MDIEKKFLSGFLEDLNANRVTLPTLPEVAIRVRRIVEDPRVTATQVEKVISTDPAMSARLLKVVNGPLYRGKSPITDLKAAITRLGSNVIRNLATSLAMEQLYQSKNSELIQRQMKTAWMHSTKVATLSHIIAKYYTRLQPDQAMLAGLVHDIGVLPVLGRAELYPELLEQPEVLDRVVQRLHTLIGASILDEWNFPKEIVAVAAEHENIKDNREGPPDYVDVVIVANLHSYLGSRHNLARVDWATVPSFTKLNLTPDESIAAMEKAEAELREMEKLLGT